MDVERYIGPLDVVSRLTDIVAIEQPGYVLDLRGAEFYILQNPRTLAYYLQIEDSAMVTLTSKTKMYLRFCAVPYKFNPYIYERRW